MYDDLSAGGRGATVRTRHQYPGSPFQPDVSSNVIEESRSFVEILFADTL